MCTFASFFGSLFLEFTAHSSFSFASNISIGSLVVIDELDADKVHGIVTHTDGKDSFSLFLLLVRSQHIFFICRAVLAKWYLESVPLNEAVRKVMTSHPIAVNMHMSKDEAAETMGKHKLHHLLVTDDEGKFYGLISSYDILVWAQLWTRKRGHSHGQGIKILFT